MPYNHESPSRGPEHGEGLRITSIVIPADESLPLHTREIGPSQLSDYQHLVGGLIDVIDIDNPPASLYVNDEGKLLDLPLNRRATVLLWAHHSGLRFRDFVAGDAFLTGQPDQAGDGTDTPEDLVRVLVDGQQCRVQSKLRGDDTWHLSPDRFAHWAGAYSHALQIARDPAVEDIKTVPAQ